VSPAAGGGLGRAHGVEGCCWADSALACGRQSSNGIKGKRFPNFPELVLSLGVVPAFRVFTMHRCRWVAPAWRHNAWSEESFPKTMKTIEAGGALR